MISVSGKGTAFTEEEPGELTKSVWTFPAVSARSIGHPAPFPEELPHRLIKLYTFKGDIILDPFCGSGTTCLSAIKNGRHYIGYDVDEKYVKLANKRILSFTAQSELFDNKPVLVKEPTKSYRAKKTKPKKKKR
jgi:site-specific DNA-methyltransferase (adenine-specific)